MIYLDYAATAPLSEVARRAWLAATETVGNASASHAAGRSARAILEDARDDIADILRADAAEIIFTSGGTESDNLAIAGPAKKGRIFTSAIEHPAVREAAAIAVAQGGTHDVIPVTPDGVVDLEALEQLLADDVSAVSVMAANNETGIIQPLDEIVRLVRQHAPDAWVHTDAVQAVGRIDIPSDYALSISGHKLGAPVGVGALVAARDYPLTALEGGGGQERKIRSGTLNVAGAAALAAALRDTVDTRRERDKRLAALGDRIVRLAESVGGRRSGGDVPRLSHIVHVIFPGADPEALLLGLDMASIACSTGSACAAGVYRPSAVLEAMGERGAHTALRFSMGQETDDSDIDALEAALPRAVEMARRAVRA